MNYNNNEGFSKIKFYKSISTLFHVCKLSKLPWYLLKFLHCCFYRRELYIKSF